MGIQVIILIIVLYKHIKVYNENKLHNLRQKQN